MPVAAQVVARRGAAWRGSAARTLLDAAAVLVEIGAQVAHDGVGGRFQAFADKALREGGAFERPAGGRDRGIGRGPDAGLRATGAEAGHRPCQTLRPIAGPKWFARSGNALNEKLFVVQVRVMMVVENSITKPSSLTA